MARIAARYRRFCGYRCELLYGKRGKRFRCYGIHVIHRTRDWIWFCCIQEKCTDGRCIYCRRYPACGLCCNRSCIPDWTAQDILDYSRIRLYYDRIRNTGMDFTAAKRLFKFIPALLYDYCGCYWYFRSTSGDSDSGIYRFPCWKQLFVPDTVHYDCLWCDFRFPLSDRFRYDIQTAW